jgi:hypothetical protein
MMPACLWSSHSTHEGREKSVTISAGQPTEKRSLARPRRRWKDTTKMDLRETDVKFWSGLSRFRLG